MELEVVDNFLKEPEAIRDYTRSLVYLGTDPENGKDGTVTSAPYWQDLEFFFYPLQPRMSFFRCGDGKSTKSLIHSDRSLGTKTCIIYLNKESEIPKGVHDGTTFYRSKRTGLLKPPPSLQLDFSAPEYQDVNKWSVVQTVEMKFNRMIYYDSRLYHARTSVEHWPGRLVQVLFF